MNYTRKLIILAKSKKFGGYCIAGKTFDNHQWIRPVKERPFSLNETKNFLDPTRSVEIFDIVEMTFKEKCPEIYQPENEKVDMDEKWVYIGKLQIEKLHNLVDNDKGDILKMVLFFIYLKKTTFPNFF